jgi:hypothetical protein
MKDYVIFKIVCKDLNVKEIYLGMTINFNVMQDKFKYIYNNRLRVKPKVKPNMILLNYIFLHGGFDNFLFEIIQTYKCDNAKEANIYKRKHYDELHPALNKNKPALSDEDRHKYQKDYHMHYDRSYQCDCGKSYTRNNFTNHCKTEFHLSHVNIN